ncbi:carbon-nitrogen hydrolase family protein [Shewanella woodyi]|uniref:Nitrilase/cyanide hydratase and apolipoprotein N-acyltransferase n=1 Tax=Shewanella woodyi (strain ATCC 51908 / MS32) TaxID=392500 RepID=B1KQP5_SHEWM|nr:carbon-nitrogen hydrolase family protein [Shewanella woodyi]ACA86284.1 Nitrilase/cyanide hydratase and apolipoprotein N-acyltransferase [Shewanella woodyi ATCC 51908]
MITEPIKTAVIQLECKLSRESGNMRRAERYIKKAIKDGAQLVCLPESFLTSGNILDVTDVAVTIPGECTDKLCQIAKEGGIYLVAGLFEVDGESYFSTSFLISPTGNIIGKYRRVHCFEMERKYISQGSDFPVFNTDIGRIGLLQGYDINFPISCMELYCKEVDIIICTALIPEAFFYVTNQLLTARAIESQCFIVFVSGIGANPYAGFKYMGRSSVVTDPMFLEKELFDFEDGDETMLMMDMDEGYKLIELDIHRLHKYRESNSRIGDLVTSSYLQGLSLNNIEEET